MSPVTTAVLHETDVQDYMKCSKIMIHAPEDKKANANFTAYFKNEATPPLQVSYRQEEVGCGHINDIYDDGQYQVYFLNVNKAVCIYRCPIAPTKGVATAGALVSVANQNSPDVVDEVQSCKESLASVGFTGHLVNVVKCSA